MCASFEVTAGCEKDIHTEVGPIKLGGNSGRPGYPVAPIPPTPPPVFQIDFLKKLALSVLCVPFPELMGQRWFCPYLCARSPEPPSWPQRAPLDLNGVNIQLFPPSSLSASSPGRHTQKVLFRYLQIPFPCATKRLIFSLL